MKTFTDILTSLSNTQAAITQTLNLLNEKINNIEEQSKPKRKYSYWASKMFPKYEELMDYLEYDSNGKLYKHLYNEFLSYFHLIPYQLYTKHIKIKICSINISNFPIIALSKTHGIYLSGRGS
jgi:soluble cytochrome b562